MGLARETRCWKGSKRGRGWNPGRGLGAELGWDRGMRSRVGACGGLRCGRLYIRGGSRREFGWMDCHMGLSGGRPSRGLRVGGLVSGEECRMGRLIRFHRGDGQGGAGRC